MRLLVATTNAGKLAELRAMLGDLGVELVSVRDLGIDGEVVEDADTFEGNARKKATELARRSGMTALADDSGLEVDALGGAPGVYSARYSGEGATDATNVAKLLLELCVIGAFDDVSAAPSARFRCVLALAGPSGAIDFVADGRCEGGIVSAPRGESGFGYDPVFVPAGESRTMAELSKQEKNALSHRGAAVKRLRAYFAQLHASQ